MKKKILYLPIVLLLVFGLVSSAALASAPPAPASPESPAASISGVVTTEMGVPIAGVTIQVSPGTSVTTDVYGAYTVPNLPDGTYTLTPVFGSYTFTPPSLTVTVPPDATNQNFVYIAPKPSTSKTVFLPLTLKNLGESTPVVCQDFSDDFSNLGSNWPTGEDQDVLAEYLNGEYHVLTKSVDTSVSLRAPTCERENYTVEVDAHWTGNDGWYGLFFGMVNDFEQYYIFDVNTYYREFSLWRSYGDNWAEIVTPTFSSAILADNATNHLKATRSGSAITLVINGVTLGTWNDTNISGPSSSGVSVATYSDVPNADARFDNFKVTSLGGPALVAGQNGDSNRAGSRLGNMAPFSQVSGYASAKSAPAGTRAQHDLSSLLSAQGTYCLPDGAGGCALFVPPYPNFIGWSNPAASYFSLVDYAGLVDQWMEANCDISLGTEITGSVVQRPEKDGRTRVTVNLHTDDALAWVTHYTDTDFPGQMLFGHYAADVCAGDEPALADSLLKIEYFVSAGKDPYLDLIRFIVEDPTELAEEGYELISLFFDANGSGPLREAFGVPEGTPGNLHITQVGTLNFNPDKGQDKPHNPWDGFPAELIELRVVGN